jgi:hypothetical protein
MTQSNSWSIFKCICFIWPVWCTLSSDGDKTGTISTQFWVYTPLTCFTSIVDVTKYKQKQANKKYKTKQAKRNMKNTHKVQHCRNSSKIQ